MSELSDQAAKAIFDALVPGTAFDWASLPDESRDEYRRAASAAAGVSGDERQPDAMVTVGKFADRIDGIAGNASLCDSAEALEEITTGLLALAEELRRAAVPSVARAPEPCATCGGHKMVPVGVSRDFDSGMLEAEDEVPCPDCGARVSTPEDERAVGAEDEAVWATVLVDRESLEPREAGAAELELLDEMGIDVKRCWIRPGPTLPRAQEGVGRASTGTEDALRKALRPFEGCWSWGVDVHLADVGALENAARAALAAARPVEDEECGKLFPYGSGTLACQLPAGHAGIHQAGAPGTCEPVTGTEEEPDA